MGAYEASSTGDEYGVVHNDYLITDNVQIANEPLLLTAVVHAETNYLFKASLKYS
jgi:hypothetical protein